MRTIIAWYFLSLSHTTREMYALLSDMCGARAFNGTNPARTVLDGILMTIVGAMIALIPLVGLLLLPLAVPYAVFANRQEWRQVKELAEEGRVDWKNGRVIEKVKAEHGSEAQ